MRSGAEPAVSGEFTSSSSMWKYPAAWLARSKADVDQSFEAIAWQ
jgi:hypothetical protein